MLEKQSMPRSWFPVLLAALMVVGGARRAHADGFISPFIGYNFGGDAGCQELTGCEDKHANYGVSFGALGSIVGFEAELAHTNDFFGSSALQSTNVLTFVGNFMIAPKLGPVQPYGLIGAGLMRTSIESGATTEDENQISWDVGGGIMVFFSQHVGVRGDIRYFHSFQALENLNFLPLPIGKDKIDFGRAAIAVVFKF